MGLGNESISSKSLGETRTWCRREPAGEAAAGAALAPCLGSCTREEGSCFRGKKKCIRILKSEAQPRCFPGPTMLHLRQSSKPAAALGGEWETGG